MTNEPKHPFINNANKEKQHYNMETVVSGIRPTGNLHLGNYFGAEGTVSEQAQKFGWDSSIWDFSAAEPKLK